MSCEIPVLGRRPCIPHSLKWNVCNINIDAHVRAVIANDIPTNHFVMLSWASHARGSLYLGYLGVHQCKYIRPISLCWIGTSNWTAVDAHNLQK